MAAGDEGTRRSGETQGRQLAGALRRAMAADADTPYVERLADGAAPAFAEGDTLAGRYRVLAFLARGGMGEVYHVHDERLGEDVALKTLRADVAARDARAAERFKREIQLARKVTHPAVVRIFDLAEHGSVAFFTMELLDGETLATRLRRDGRFTADAALPLVEPMAAGLDAAHDAGVVHRDFKTSNVVLGAGGRVTITDFGIARAIDRPHGTLTETGEAIGTPAYMAPEQLEGGEVTASSDVYSLGVVLYELVTGRRPFAGETSFAEAVQRYKEPPPSPRAHVPELDRRWETAILRCLEIEPRHRFARAGDVVRALRGELKVVPRGRNRRLAIGAGAALAAVVATGLVALAPRSSDPPSEPTERRLTALAGEGIHDAALSADGKRLAYITGADRSLHLLTVDTGEEQPLALPEGSLPRHLAWHPDGTRVVTADQRGVSWGRVDGSGWTRIRDDGGVWAVAVSHRGDDIAFMHERGLWVMRADGADPRRLVEHTISPNTPTPLWSPDDRRLAYFHREGRTTEELRAIDLESGAITTLRQDPRMSNAMGAASAAWLGDGRIVYAMRDDDGSSLWQSTLSGAPVRRKGFPGATLFVVNASGDGTRLAYAPVISQTDVYATEVTSSLALRQLTSHRRDDYPLAFTADGAGLVLLSDRRGHGMDIYRQELGARDAVLVGKGGCVHALAPGGGEVLVGREVEGALRFVGYDLTPGAVERRLPLTARDCQAKLRCGRAGCVLSEKVDDRLVLSRVDPASTASTPFARLAVSRSVWHLDAAGERVLIEDDAKRLLSIATRDGVITELAKPGCNLDFAFWGNGDDLFLTCVRRDPLLHSLVHRTVDGGETTLWSSAEQYLGSVTLSPDGRTMAVALRSFDANVWMLEGL